jgi:hypothetical protein
MVVTDIGAYRSVDEGEIDDVREQEDDGVPHQNLTVVRNPSGRERILYA